MPPSQLKQLKASLRDNGILGPQKSKKQKKASNKDAQKRIQRNAALEGIRERFNPFEAKAPARKEKFDISSNRPTKKTIERPGVTRGLGEERRRETLLKEIQSRNKVGGMLDRRFGEDDPNMTPEQKAAERFAQQALRANKKSSMFNLEDDSDEELLLTHGGRALDLTGKPPIKDDFDEDLSGSEAADFDAQDDRPRKRVRLEHGGEEDEEEEEEEEEGDEDEMPQRRKTKNEVMQEVIAKSKAYKAARQAQKEDDEDLRAELDKGLGDIFAALNNHRTAPKHLPSPPLTDSEPKLDPSRAAMLAGKSREEAEKEYEANIRQMKLDARSKPTFRTKTEEEKAAESKERLDELERKRLQRMRGEAESSEDEGQEPGVEVDLDADENDDAEAFGLEQPGPRYIPDLAVEDEDEFVMDDILASDSEADAASDFEDDDESTLQEPEDDGDDDFINGLVLPKQPATVTNSASTTLPSAGKSLPFKFACPQDLEELIEETSKLSAENLPTALQRIRALYHKGLDPGNEEKLGKFSQALIFWIAALVNNECPQKPSMQIIEQILRHAHSMAKTQPHDVAAGFREYLRQFLEEDRKSLDTGDLIILTGVSSIFPTSDQWHTVVTPSMLVLARYLAQASMENMAELAKGVYACSLALRYQAISRRYVPEVITFISKAIQLLAPNEGHFEVPSCTTPSIIEESTCRIAKKVKKAPSAKLSFADLRALEHGEERHSITSESLLLVILSLSSSCIDYYATKSAFPELMAPIHHLVKHRLSTPSSLALLHTTTQTQIQSLSSRLEEAFGISISNRKPLLLHSHRPLAIKSSYPLFDSSYNPTRKQRDPDAERAEINKLKAEHKKERKGAMRELRKDANFMAREQLREKKAKDEAYEKKFKRLVAEIQGEEGREAKSYERERAKRKGRF